MAELPGKSDAQPRAWGRMSERSTKDDDSDAQLHDLTHLASRGVALSPGCPLPIPYSSVHSLWFTCFLFPHPKDHFLIRQRRDGASCLSPRLVVGSGGKQSQVWPILHREKGL